MNSKLPPLEVRSPGIIDAMSDPQQIRFSGWAFNRPSMAHAANGAYSEDNVNAMVTALTYLLNKVMKNAGRSERVSLQIPEDLTEKPISADIERMAEQTMLEFMKRL